MAQSDRIDHIRFALIRFATYGAFFGLAAFFVGLVAACFVPPEWVVTKEDASFLQSNPHGVIDLVDDYQKLLDGRPMTSERQAALHDHLRQLWINFWLRWGAFSVLFGATLLGVNRSFGNRAGIGFVLVSGIGFVLFIGTYLVTHPGFDPLN